MHRLLHAVASVCVVAGAAAQTELPRATTDAQLSLVEQITRLRAEGGPTPQGTIEPLRALALLYQENGDNALAITLFEEARHVTRVHRGLASADEAILLREQLRSEKVLGNHMRMWDLEQDMTTIARQNHDDLRMVPIFRELAEDRLEALEQYRAGYFPPEVDLGCYYVRGMRRYDETRGERRAPVASEDTCRSGSKSTVYRQLRTEILMYYADAIEVFVRIGDFEREELRDLERQAFREQTFPGPVEDVPLQRVGLRDPATRRGPIWAAAPSLSAPQCSSARVQLEALDELLASEILGSCLDPLLQSNELIEANVGGWVSLVRLIAYESRSGASATARGNAFSRLADWQLLISAYDGDQSSGLALALYERAYRELQQDVEARTAMFSPEAPIPLAPNPFGAPGSTAAPRYIDVRFNITKYGRSERIAIQDAPQGATRAETRDVMRSIEAMKFRPRFVNGEVADSAPVVVRFPLSP